VLEIQMNELPADETKLNVRTNKTLLTLAITNIIQNGFKFSSGKPVVCSLHFAAGKIIINITDKGIGIDAATLPHIFEPFYRSTDANAYEGHGIGLYIAKKIIELLGGEITVQSRPGTGSTFNIILPLNT
jgi:signal transduction histidine kinase